MGSRKGHDSMITTQFQRDGAQVKVTFAVPAGKRRVAVAGDFNDWDATATPLRKRGDNRSASVTLEPGRRCAFRYIDEDGRWFNDEHADEFEPNGFGDKNGVIVLRSP